MNFFKKNNYPLTLTIIAILALLILQSVWLYSTYEKQYLKLTCELQDVLLSAYQKEQTYRAPVTDIIGLGTISMERNDKEKIMIIRQGNNIDTIAYRNISGYSVEQFIQKSINNIREQLNPINLYCLSDLFAGILHGKKYKCWFFFRTL